MLNFYEKLDFGAMFDFHDFQKGTFWTPYSATKVMKNHGGNLPGPTWGAGPPRNGTVITMVSWTYWFFKGHFFDGDWLIFIFLCFSMCYVLYAIFITFAEMSASVTLTKRISTTSCDMVVDIQVI